MRWAAPRSGPTRRTAGTISEAERIAQGAPFGASMTNLLGARPLRRTVRPWCRSGRKVMSKRKTEEQISAEIAALVALKPKVRQRTAFGDDNHAAIDAQLAVLRDA